MIASQDGPRRELLSLTEVERRLRVRHGAARELIDAGKLETVSVEGRERVTAASLDRYVGRTPAAAGLDHRALAALLRRCADWLESQE